MKVYNTLTRTKEEFVPIHEGEARIYACGPTVYNYFHIGNARPFVVFDTLRRYLEYRGYRVIFVQNFTDIDDKMIQRAQEEDTTVAALAEHYIAEYYKDADSLGIERASVNPRATEHIAEIIELVQTLIEKGHAYVTEAGDVYYSTSSFASYGKLSGQKLEDLEAGARVETTNDKRESSDFALWKAQKPGEPAWESPWGLGRPGWHIECSAMSMKYLGKSFDIHCGGQDLIFPHHENEIAQSEGATGEPFARYWMHNGYINIDNQKMSKSKGNFFTVRDITETYDPQVLRLFILSAQYRSPINFSRDLLDAAVSSLARFRTAEDILENAVKNGETKDSDPAFLSTVNQHRDDFIAAMDDDLNTADALASIFELVRDSNSRYSQEDVSSAEAEETLSILRELLAVLGLSRPEQSAIDEEIYVLADTRQVARSEKNWAESDRLRDALAEKGYVVEDGKDGYKLKRL